MRIRVLPGAATAVSLLIVAWFALAARQAHDTSAASAIVASGTPLSTAQVRHAAGLLRSAQQLNPDTQVDVLRAELDLDQGSRRAARTILERVVASEPENAVAWYWLAHAAVGDRNEFFVAAFQLNQLVRVVPGRH